MSFCSVSSQKESNRNKILHLIFRNGPISRISISKNYHLTPASVTNNVSLLIAEGLVEEIDDLMDPTDSVLGRKRILIDLIPHSFFSIGCEITEKFFNFCIIDLKGTCLHKIQLMPTPNDFLEINKLIIDNISTIVNGSNLHPSKFIGIGIALPGHYDAINDSFISNNPRWKHFSLTALKAHLPYPIVCENNVHCMACGEYYFNHPQSPSSFNFFHLGRGIFNSNVSDGKLIRGTNFLGGEIGHTIIQPDGMLCECGKRGCLQTYCSETWLIKKCQQIYLTFPECILSSLVKDASLITIDIILIAYSMGDPLIVRIFSDMIQYLSISLSNVMIINNPSKILLHSVLFQNELLKQELLKAIHHHLSFINPLPIDSFEILPYSSYRGATGAGALAISAFLLSK